MQTAATNTNTGDTRERIVRMLQRREYTIEGLSEELGITKNAVRSQMNLLGKEGLVEAKGSIPSGRRPAKLYGVRRGSINPFSKAYPLVLSELIQVLAERLSPEQFLGTVEDLGARLANLGPRPAGSVRNRLQNAVSFLESLGSTVDVAEKKGKITIKGYGCPIAGAVNIDKRLCIAMAVMISKLLELPVSERCDREGQPGCCFEIDASKEKKTA